MSEGLIIALLSVIGSAVVAYLTVQGTAWVNKRKVPAEVEKIGADTRLVNGELAGKYQQIASNTADENIELATQLKAKEAEKKQLNKVVDELRQEMLTMDQRHIEELNDLRKEFEDERLENLKFKDWAERLVYQIKSFGLTPVPFDIEEAKKKGFPLGETGPC
jgi:flagellar motility protein MotE (MotC chaperone)